ncbi:ribosomal protein L3 N(5)-glutamine methyltransferase [Hahella sp. CCB-MM4]|uniref:50S ribosomal protein L3 N(5)-glutamine methyltransferase n=1 Tax=Hahella sp. (strain CCB-MM4) TaxID=1926491 RepID=UPI000B9BC505|nr:50S ribosomal protein L3 N(5)-glutamine methyltransferase [Hahella sp. CCB-MM4]OZG73669.1 ribosomal protein L3 N(5)-glutamine methyltransferase [Hahella sp. CCB-MM4]
MFDANTLAPLQTIQDYLRYAYSKFREADLFYGHGTDNAWDEAVHLVAGVLHLPWDVSPSLLAGRLTDMEKEALAIALKRRVVDREPVAYILGESWFMGLPFKVTPDVLIPRSPLAEMLTDELQPWLEGLYPERILDLCCGSGCIGIAAAYVFEDTEVVMTDISDPAIDIARENIDRHAVSDRVTVVKSDLLGDVEGTFDVILTNPPYVDQPDMTSLPPEFLHEPRLGLESGEDGLDATKKILADAANYLNEGGILVCEVGNSIDALFEQFPDVMFICPEFEHGGHGVFVLTKEQLVAHQDQFKAAAGTI